MLNFRGLVYTALCLACCAAAGGVSLAQQKPELYLQSGHKSEMFGVRGLLLTPDGRTLVTAEENETKFWDVEGALELRTLPYGVSVAGNLALSPDGKRLAVSGIKGVRLYDIATGERAGSFDGTAVFAYFSRDGASLYVGNDEPMVRVYRLADGELLRSFKVREMEESGASFRFAVSPDEKVIASARAELLTRSVKTIELHELATGRRLAVLQGHTDAISCLAFSPDGRLLASGDRDNLIRLWDVAAGKEVRTFTGHEGTVHSLVFGRDGKTLFSSGSEGSVRRWEVATGRELRRLVAATADWKSSNPAEYTTLNLSRDGRTLLGGADKDGVIKFWDAEAGVEVRSLRGSNSRVWASALSPDGKLIASGDVYSSVRLWERATGVARRLELKAAAGGGARKAGNMKVFAFSPDSKILLAADFDNHVRSIEVSTGTQRFDVETYRTVEAVAYSPNGSAVAYSTNDGQVLILEAATGRRLQSLEIKSPGSSSAATLAFGRDGKLLATAGEEDSIALWNTATGQRARTLKGVTPIGVAFSPDGTKLVSVNFSSSTSISIWDVNTGERREVEFAGSAGNDFPQEVVFSPDGKMFATGGYSGVDQGTVRLYDAVAGRHLAELPGHKNTVRAVGFGPDGKTLISASLDGMLKLWDVATRRELASLVGIDEADWLVVTTDGLFDGSPAGWSRALWRFSPQLYDVAPAEAYFNEFYTPGLLTDLLAGRRPRAAQSIAQKDRRQPHVSLTADGGASAVSSVGVQIKIADAPAGAQDVRLFRNGSLVKVWPGDALQGKAEATLTATIPAVAGENRLTAYAFNHDNVKSADATLLVTGAESLRRKGTAYVLAVGVNSYANRDFDLKYAVADVEDFTAEWQAQQAKLQTFAGTEVVTLKDSEATKANMLKALSELKTKVKPEDALVVYFAGHGTAQQNRFYLIPHDLGYTGGRDAIDEAGLKTILTRGVSDLELQDALEGIDAGQMILVIDACNSGQALEAEEKRRGPMNSKGLEQLAYEKGMYILTAAQSYQAAQEASKFGHGFLTYALVEEGVKLAKADGEPRDGQVFVREWFDYAARRVPQMQVELMQEAQGKRGVKVAFVEGEEQIADPAERNVQRPRAFYRREAESRPLVVASGPR